MNWADIVDIDCWMTRYIAKSEQNFSVGSDAKWKPDNIIQSCDVLFLILKKFWFLMFDKLLLRNPTEAVKIINKSVNNCCLGSLNL